MTQILQVVAPWPAAEPPPLPAAAPAACPPMERLRPFIAATAKAESLDALRAQLAALALEFGFEHFMFALRVPTHFANARIVELDGAPPGWMRRYFEKAHYEADPVLAHCTREVLPVRWSDLLIPAGSAASRVMEDAADWGMREGVSMPVHSPRGELGVLSLATGLEPGLAHSRTELGLALVQWVAGHVNEAVRRLSTPPRPMRALTRRETDCLRWAADGKTSAEIALLLGVAESTANFHLNKAIEKLGVTTRQQAVALAALTGRVKPKPF